jgi:hypothetical protein
MTAVTIAGIVRRVDRGEQTSALMRDLGKAIASDPMLATIQATGRKIGWGAEETEAYMILCLLERAQHAELLLVNQARCGTLNQIVLGVRK